MRRLEQRPFGQNGEQVTAVSLGGCGLPRVSFADGVATVHRALELGVNYLTPRRYTAAGWRRPFWESPCRNAQSRT